MLQYFRDRAQGIIAWIIVILIIIPFAFWGINQYFSGGGEIAVATVGDAEIPVREFQRAFQQERSFRQQLLGGELDPQLMSEAVIKRDTLERLINAEVVAQAARAANLRVGDALLARRIQNIQEFQRDGRFDQELYGRVLQSAGLSQGQFETHLRREMLGDQIMAAVAEGALLTDSELDAMARRAGQQRKVGYFVVPASERPAGAEVSEQQIADYYAAHRDRYAVPEQVRIAYVELSLAPLRQAIVPDEAEVRAMYEEHAAQYRTAEERRARHILFIVDPAGGAAADAAAKAQAEEILERIRAGASFEALAKERSADNGSAAEGGDLGFFGRGAMVKAFEDAAFALSVGEVSAPVRTPFGYHLIKLEAIKPAAGKPFAEVRADLEKEYRTLKAEEQFFDRADLMADLAYEHPDSLDPLAKELNLPVRTSGWFGPDAGTDIAAERTIREAAFGHDVLEAGNNTEPLQIGDNRLVVLRVTDRNPATTRPLDEVRGAIATLLRHEAAQRASEEAGAALLARVRAGERIEALAGETGAVWRKPVFVGRQDSAVPAEVIDAAFKLARPAAGESAAAGVGLDAGGYALLAVYEVRDGDPTGLADEQRAEQRANALRALAQQDAASFRAGLKRRAEIRVFEENL